MVMTRYEKIKETIEEMNTSEIVELHNEYCENTNCIDDRVYNMCELNEMLSGYTPEKILNLAFYGDFNPNDYYFAFNGYGNLISFDFEDDEKSPIYISDIAHYIVDNDDSLNNDDIQEILDEYANSLDD